MLESTTDLIQLPLYETADSGGSGGGGAAPMGAEPAGGATPATPAEPSVLDVDDNALIRVKGSEKPVKFGDHVRGFQSQFTKASQKAAQLEKALQERENRIKQYEQQLEQARHAPQPNQPDVYDSLRQLPYLTGEDAVGMVQHIGQQIKQRDQVLLGALQQLQKMQQMVGSLHETHTNSSFEGKISKWLTDGGYDPGYANLAKEIYLAYEGDDLDQEFPQIFASRVEEIERLFEAKRAAKINAAKRVPFVPGKGAIGTPSKPLEPKPNATAREIADQLWGQWNGSET